MRGRRMKSHSENPVLNLTRLQRIRTEEPMSVNHCMRARNYFLNADDWNDDNIRPSVEMIAKPLFTVVLQTRILCCTTLVSVEPTDRQTVRVIEFGSSVVVTT